ncbi:hypothetical protein JTB14_036960 [Gonioctena quinquepunctata]|nr:hypothetical protein JTB14_036960 [Gonioctena quinquepunctata]
MKISLDGMSAWIYFTIDENLPLIKVMSQHDLDTSGQMDGCGIRPIEQIDFENILYEISNNFARESIDNFEIETYNFEDDDDQLFEKKSDQQNEQEIEHGEIEIGEAEQEEDDSNKENSEQPLNLSSKRKR